MYTNFRGSNVPEDGAEYKSFTVISIGSLIVYDNKYYLQGYLNNCVYKIAKAQMVDYRDGNLFESRENQFLIYRFHKSCITIELT